MDFNMFIFVAVIVVKVYYPSWLGFAYNWNYIGQFVPLYLVLIIIFGLTLDGGKSVTGKIFR